MAAKTALTILLKLCKKFFIDLKNFVTGCLTPSIAYKPPKIGVKVAKNGLFFKKKFKKF